MPFVDTAWKTARADAMETEAEALDDAITRLVAVREMLHPIERQTVNQAVAVLERVRSKLREHAAVLRQAA